MKESRFISVFSSLDQKDQQKFLQLISCEAFNKRRILAKLLHYLLPSIRDVQEKSLSLNEAFDHFFPGESYDPKRVHALMGALYKQLLRYLAWKKMEEDEMGSSILSLKALRELKANAAFEAEAKRLKSKLGNQDYRDDNYSLHTFQVAREEDYYLTQSQIRKSNEAFQQQMDALDLFYFGSKFALSAEALSRNRIIEGAYRASLLEPLCSLYDDAKEAHLHGIWVRIQRHLLLCLQEPDETLHYENYIALLEKHKAILSLDTLRYLYKSAQNYCIRRINSGDTSFQEAIFDLFQTMLEQGLLINEQGHITHSDVKNIVTVALRQEAFAWTSSFIEAFGPRVHDKHRDNVMSYCQALYDANTGKPQLAIRRLREVSFTDMLYDLSARRLLAQIFFEQEDWEALSHHMNAFELFLRRQKQLSTHNRNSHLNFVRILKAIAKLSEQREYRNDEINNKRQAKLLLRIETTDSLAYREWLLGLLKD